MAASIVDLIIVLLIIAYIFWKRRSNLDWFLLVIILALFRGAFDVCVIFQQLQIVDFSVSNLNMFSRVIHWLSISVALYYSIRGERCG